jgi:thiosulfate dehydrogenase [quinone] large subunit
VLGALWLHEGLFKYRAGFGRADILLVVDSVSSNRRVPGFFVAFSDFALKGAPGVFGVAMPLVETLLGVALILGVATLPAAIASILTLLTYWSADQLVNQYPVMAALSILIIIWPVAAARISTTTLILHGLQRRRAVPLLSDGPLRRWL